MIWLVCGGRTFSDRDYMFSALDELRVLCQPIKLIHGAARGADRMADAWAASRGVPALAMPAQWDRYGRRAGSLRNEQMLLEQPDLVIAFTGGVGTAHMVRIARRDGYPVLDLRTN